MSSEHLWQWARRHGIPLEALDDIPRFAERPSSTQDHDLSDSAMEPSAHAGSAVTADLSWLEASGELTTSSSGAPSWLDPESEAPAQRIPIPPKGLKLMGRLGLGGMGEVVQVYDHRLRRLVALKVLREELVHHPTARARFLAEAQITAQLQHPGVLPIHDIGELEDRRPYFTMKKVVGHTLRDEIAALHGRLLDGREPPTRRAVLGIFRRVCEAVAYAHDRGVVHRDLKPDNVMVGRFGTVHVLDWGLARVLHQDDAPSWEQLQVDPDTQHLTRLGTAAGTPGYMSPEQRRGDLEQVGPASDVFSLGIMLWEILQGTSPLQGSDDQNHDVRAIPVPPPSPDHPPGLVHICMKAVAVEPGDRYPSGEALAEALGRWMDDAQRRTEALELVDRAAQLVDTEQRLRQASSEAHATGQAVLSEVASHAPLEQKEAGWRHLDEARALATQAEETAWDRIDLLEAALTRDASLPEAHDALAEFHRAAHQQAEQGHRTDDAVRHMRRLVRHDRGRHRRYIRGRGALTLITQPPAEVRLHRMVSAGRRLTPQFERSLGQTPLLEHPLELGSYLLTLHAPGCDVVRYPVHIRREEHWSGIAPGESTPRPIWLPPEGTLTAQDVYIPCGWYTAGTHKPIPHALSEQRVWSEAWVIGRDVITQAEYLAFLNALVAAGREEEARAAAPRERSSRPGEPGALCYGVRPDGTYHLVPDAEGDLWDPRWPAFMVSWRAASAYAQWRAEDGLGWQLPPEHLWEKAARGVDGREYPWGPHVDPSFACVRGSRPGRPLPARVDEFPLDESVFGVRGVAGNVREWCLDPFSADPKKSNERVVRGGCWFFPETGARPANRYALGEHNRGDTVGFRIARPIEAPA